MYGLHGGNCAIPAKTRDISGIDNLRMFDPPAPIALVGQGKLINRIKHFGIGGVTDRVHRHLEIIECCKAQDVRKFGRIDEGQPALTRLVSIVLFEPSPARSERTVGIEFDTDHPQAITVKPRRWSAARNRKRRFDASRIGDDPHPQIAEIAEAAIGVPVVCRGAHVCNCSDAQRNKPFLRL